MAEASGWPDARGDFPPPATESADSLAGEYEVRPGFRLRVVRGPDGLSLKIPGQGRLPLRRTADDSYAVGPLNARLHVRRDAAAITGVTIRQDMSDVTAHRVPDGT